MKKKYFYVGAIALCSVLTFSSCGNDDDPIGNGTDTEVAAGEQVIVLDMQDTDVLSTKSRPLYSTENKGAEQVTDVQLLVFGIKPNNGRYEFVKKLPAITNWNNTSDDYNYGRKHSIKLTGNDKLDDQYQKYIILAVGQDESDKSSIPAPFKIELGTGTTDDKFVSELVNNTWTAATGWNVAAEPGNGFMQTAALDYTKADAGRAGEIFSGVSTPIEFTIEGGFSTTVLLKRQVAGVMGYFERIPGYVGDAGQGQEVYATGIRLVASNRNNALDLTTSLGKQVDDTTHGNEGYQNTEEVVNGYNDVNTKNEADACFGVTADLTQEDQRTNDAYIMYEIDLKKWFEWDTDNSKWKDECYIEEDGKKTNLLGNSANWQNAIDPSNTNVELKSGSALAGEFVIPFEKATPSNTFELQLINEDADGKVKVLKTWSVKLDQLSQNAENGPLFYNIYRNHMYQIGAHGTETEPGKPQPLDKDQELVIKINDQWEFIHDMEIE